MSQTATFIGNNWYINPTYIVSCPEYDRPLQTRSSKNNNSLKNLKDNDHKGKMSTKSANKLRNSINWLAAASKRKKVWSNLRKRHFYFKVGFITLTVPNVNHGLSDTQFKKLCLHRFVQWARKQKGLKNYVWKVETQKNGQIHVHIAVDTFIHYSQVRKEWNNILRDLGIIDLWHEQGNTGEPPSTEIKVAKGVKNIAAYLGKYFVKNDEARRSVTGRLWGSNYELSANNKLVVFIDKFDTDQLASWVNNPLVEKIERDYFTIYLLKPGSWGSVIKGTLYEIFNNHLFNIRYNLNHQHVIDFRI